MLSWLAFEGLAVWERSWSVKPDAAVAHMHMAASIPTIGAAIAMKTTPGRRLWKGGGSASVTKTVAVRQLSPKKWAMELMTVLF